ncbi:MAG: arginine--tRNA ligase, partial [Candidatus Pacebacteria bacterium]|nr:arginine--tRNA ligase [Candidatus Paceibacterota bacterium]
QAGKPPAEIAAIIAENIPSDETIEKTTAAGPYVNFRIKPRILFNSVLEEIIARKGNYGFLENNHQKQRVMVEYLSPNTNKPLHLGHLRNGALGMATANMLAAAGAKIIKANLVNDRGVHICKSMLAWQKWANGETPESAGEKGDHFVGRWYVKYAVEAEKDPSLEQEVQAMLKKWEQGDPEIIKLWEMMNNWVYEGFKATYERFGLRFDVFFYESQTYKLGKNIAQNGLNKAIFQKTDKGSIVVELPPDEFGMEQDGQLKKITLLREDGTSVYITQDLGTAVLKFQDYDLNQSIYVVGSEQNYHFRVLFKLLEMLGYAWAKNCRHLSYGMVYLPEGKMKSREGKIVDADDLIVRMENLAREEIEKRHKEEPLGEKEVSERALKIALGAIKFYLLRVGAEQDIHFNPQESLSFEGFTGPYCQYAYARARSILRSEAAGARNKIDYSLLGNEQELLLAQKLMAFPQVIKAGAEALNPSKIAVYVYDLAKAFNQFYQKHSVLSAQNQETVTARLTLVSGVAIIIKQSLGLLGIDVLEEM